MKKGLLLTTLAVSAVSMVLLSGCSKKDATTDAAPPAAADARPDQSRNVNKAAVPGAPGAAKPSDAEAK